jgi:quinol monooxygenase YgiN
MVIEIALLKAKGGVPGAAALRAALQTAQAVIERAPGCRGSVFHQGIEEPESFLLRVEWESLDAHMQRFRQGPLLAEWRAHFSHLLDAPPKVTHYEVLARL